MKPIRNKHISVYGFTTILGKIKTKNDKEKIIIKNMKPGNLEVIITNDEKGKTLSIYNELLQFTIPFEPIERYLK